MRTVTEGFEITHFEQLQVIQDEHLNSLTITAQALAGSTVQSSTYTSVTFSSCVFQACSFKQVKFTNCTFKQCNFEFSHLYACHFENCVFEDCQWPASSIHGSSLIDCELDTWLSALTESHENVLHFTYAERQREAEEVHTLMTAAFVAA